MDMNAFFAAIEQLDHPEWHGRPIAITNGQLGTCIITSSYEARSFGIKTGMRLREARKLCPHLIQVASRPRRYTAVSTAIMAGLQEITPDIEIFSVDEAFLDVTHVQALHGPPGRIARMVKLAVFKASGLLCSVGVSGDKTTAKYAAKQQKPNGLTLIPPSLTAQRLANVPVTELCGIGKGIGAFLARHGVHYCGDMQRLPISVLAERYGNVGRRIWSMCQGKDPSPVQSNIAAPKSMGHGKVIPPDSRSGQLILTYLMHMSEKVAARLRQHHMEAIHFWIGIKSNQGWLGERCRLAQPGSDGRSLQALCHQVFQRQWHGQGIYQVQVTALNPQPAHLQMELFTERDPRRYALNQVMDSINQRYGDFTLAPARLLSRSKMPDVIAPAWQPSGPRKSV
ncbi:MAG: DNA polymerase IV [Gammaproteobacteria bacterium]|nr:DNA polymerase IV [Gammaproteobacteria bacterium]MCF6230715.1 DNA polymerase IV [Gammaproteobacteria bacterium]